MRVYKKPAVLAMLICLMLAISGCGNKSVSETDSQHAAGNEDLMDDEVMITWDELICDNGVTYVNEDLLIKNTDKEALEYIARQFQDLCAKIDEKGNRDKNYWLTGQWYSDVMDSEQYKNVISLGNKAAKPLFLIIYKSDHSGLYEWICSKALEELFGFDFSEENNGNGWSSSKEFLELFIKRVTEQEN